MNSLIFHLFIKNRFIFYTFNFDLLFTQNEPDSLPKQLENGLVHISCGSGSRDTYVHSRDIHHMDRERK